MAQVLHRIEGYCYLKPQDWARSIRDTMREEQDKGVNINAGRSDRPTEEQYAVSTDIAGDMARVSFRLVFPDKADADAFWSWLRDKILPETVDVDEGEDGGLTWGSITRHECQHEDDGPCPAVERMTKEVS